MKRIIETTDHQHMGEVIDELQNPIVFINGEKMAVEKIQILENGVILLYNSNYQIKAESL